MDIEFSSIVPAFREEWAISEVVSKILQEAVSEITGHFELIVSDDMRESPSVRLMEKLRDLGVAIAYSDPHISIFPNSHEHSFDLSSADLNPESLSSFDLLLLATSHDIFDYATILQYSQLIVDARGVYLEPSNKVVKA